MIRRILTLDILRGWLLLVIAIDHFYRFPSIFTPFTGMGLTWVSAAEGFFIISGLLVGYVYISKFRHQPERVIYKLWRRSAWLYILSVALTLGFTLWGQILPSSQIKYGLASTTNPGQLLLNTLSLRYAYSWADFLPYYAVFMFFAPLALWLISRRRTLLLILLSGYLWLGGSRSWYTSWQLLFVTGLIAGAKLPVLSHNLTSSRLIRRTLFICAGLTYFASWIFTFPQNVINFGRGLSINLDLISVWSAQLQPLFDKPSLGLGRFIVAIIWFAAAYAGIRPYESQIHRITRGFLSRLGRDSLYVYILEAILLFTANFWLPSVSGFMANSLITFGLIGVIYLGVYLKAVMIKLIFTKHSPGYQALTVPVPVEVTSEIQ